VRYRPRPSRCPHVTKRTPGYVNDLAQGPKMPVPTNLRLLPPQVSPAPDSCGSLPREGISALRHARLPDIAVYPGSGLVDPDPALTAFFTHFAEHAGLGRPAFSGQRNWCYFMLRAAGSGTRRGPLAESGSRVPNEDACDYNGSQCTAQYPPALSSASDTGSGRRARLSPPR
jgi:hypothetical protein